MNKAYLRNAWKQEEEAAHIHGWDFSHIHDRYEEENDLPWDYEEIVRQYLHRDLDLLDYDTGGGEFLLSLDHPYSRTAATEGYPPNVKLCREKLLPLGIHFRECHDPSKVPFEDGSFDLVINRHGETEKPFPHLNLTEQRKYFEDAGFEIVRAEEAYRPIKFYDVGAFVWFAHIIEWEFPNFSVDQCFEQLLNMQKMIDKDGRIEGTIHRYLIVAKK